MIFLINLINLMSMSHFKYLQDSVRDRSFFMSIGGGGGGGGGLVGFG